MLLVMADVTEIHLLVGPFSCEVLLAMADPTKKCWFVGPESWGEVLLVMPYRGNCKFWRHVAEIRRNKFLGDTNTATNPALQA